MITQKSTSDCNLPSTLVVALIHEVKTINNDKQTTINHDDSDTATLSWEKNKLTLTG